MGGLFITYKEYLSHWIWKERRDIELRYKKICEICGSSKFLHVHHITYENIGNEKSRDLLVVCKKCHDSIHGSDRYPQYDPKVMMENDTPNIET